MLRRQNEGNSANGSLPTNTSQPSHCLHAYFSGCWGSSFRARPQGEDLGWPPWRYSKRVSMKELRESRENPGPARKARDLCHKDPPTLLSQTACRSLPFWVPEVGQTLAVDCYFRGRHTKASVHARGKGKNAAMVLTPKVAATTKPQAGTGHCPHFPRRLGSMALLRDTWSGANTPLPTPRELKTCLTL